MTTANHCPPQTHPALLSIAAFCTAVLLLGTSGCLAIGVTEEVRIEDSDRLQITFPSVKAAHDFHDGLQRSNKEAYTDAGTFLVPFVVARRTEIYHETQHYNAVVRRADIDGNGEITEAEASAYLAREQETLASDTN